MSFEFAKGHGTENDFVIVADPDGQHQISTEKVRQLCDRRAGIGGDGLLRIVRSSQDSAAVNQAHAAEWFMDYRNADGSVAEMCGNGLRVFARYLVDNGLAKTGEFNVATRDGLKAVRVSQGGPITVELSPARLAGEAKTQVAGHTLVGTIVNVGNPHLVCLPSDDITELDLTRPPQLDGQFFPTGANVEFVNVLDQNIPHVRMRVYERGSGETRSCGTGAVAVAAVTLRSYGRDTGTVIVDVPGGQLEIDIARDVSYLTGPAVIVAKGQWMG